MLQQFQKAALSTTTLSATKSPSPANHQGVKPDPFAFRWEPINAFIREAMPLFRRHHAALINIPNAPFDPDFERYYALERMGHLVVLTLRYDGLLVGYSFWTLAPHAFHASLFAATNETYWIDEAYRSGSIGLKLFKLAEQGLRKLGVKLLFSYAQLGFADGGVGKILEHLGWLPMDQTYIKDLRDEQRTDPAALPVR